MVRNINSRSRLSWSVYPVGGIRNRGDQNSSKLSLQALASKTHFCMEEIFHFLFRFFSTYPHVNFFWFIAWVAGCITFCVVLHCVLCLNWAVPEKAFGLLNCINIWQNTKYLLKSNVQVQWKMNYTCRNKKGWNRIKKWFVIFKWCLINCHQYYLIPDELFCYSFFAMVWFTKFWVFRSFRMTIRH